MKVDVPDRLSKMPISAPVWVWALYGGIVIVMCILSRNLYPFAAAAFSFQFWTFACWSGIRRSQ